ncbi:hypothetical protein DB346_08600 [Verrucomicrobia bacterium LW23]|nr:hypothetical protein DB346_08600 [Verrucomicrobia bacterium LW23]
MSTATAIPLRRTRPRLLPRPVPGAAGTLPAPASPARSVRKVHPVVRDTITAFSLDGRPETWVPLLLGVPLATMIPLVTFGVKRWGFTGLTPYGFTVETALFTILCIIVLGGLVFSALKMADLFGSLFGFWPGVAMTVLAEATMTFLPMKDAMCTALVLLCLAVLVGCNVVAAVKQLRVYEPKLAAPRLAGKGAK